MDLPRTPDGNVTPLGLVRILRGVTHKTLARQLQVEPGDILAWETGRAQPARAQTMRLGLALSWPWRDLAQAPMDEGFALGKLNEARQAMNS